jgi:hypothetical protein
MNRSDGQLIKAANAYSSRSSSSAPSPTARGPGGGHAYDSSHSTNAAQSTPSGLAPGSKARHRTPFMANDDDFEVDEDDDIVAIAPRSTAISKLGDKRRLLLSPKMILRPPPPTTRPLPHPTASPKLVR